MTPSPCRYHGQSVGPPGLRFLSCSTKIPSLDQGFCCSFQDGTWDGESCTYLGSSYWCWIGQEACGHLHNQRKSLPCHLFCVALRCFCSRLFACKAVPTEPAAQQQGACQCDFTFSLSTSVRPPFPSFCLATTLTFSKRLVKAKKGRKRCVCDRVCQQNKTQKRVSDGMMGEAQEKNEQSKKKKERTYAGHELVDCDDIPDPAWVWWMCENE